MPRIVWLLMALWMAVFAASIAGAAEEETGLDATPRVLDRFALDLRAALPTIIDNVADDGSLRLVIPEPELDRVLAQGPLLSEGYYLAIAPVNFQAPKIENASLLRLQVTDVADKGALTAAAGKAATRRLKPRDMVLVFRPRGTTTKQLRAVPAITPLEEGLPPAAAAPADRRALQDAHLMQSLNNLKQIGLALHNFHDIYGSFPPALVRGPDGKPWHSWRVILLPFLEQRALYDQYRFDEPWDGPNNKPLIEKMPDVYSDPIHGENKDHYTHYAAITGAGTSFSAEGLKFDGRKPVLGKDTRVRDIVDGTSNTLLAGSVSPGEKIPWTKPQDLVLTDDFPSPGEKGSFALPYKLAAGNCGVFLIADGSVQLLSRPSDMAKFRGLLSIDGREANDGSLLGSIPHPAASRSNGPAGPMVFLLREGDKVTARLVLERAGRPPKVVVPR